MLITVVCFFTVSAVVITASLFEFIVIPNRDASLYRYNSKMLEINQLIEKYYIGEIDPNIMADGISYGYVAGLNDRYAAYITADEAEETMNSLLGYNTGMGIQIVRHPDTGNMYVTEVHAGSPADIGGILPKDQIFSLDEYTVTDIGYSESLAYIKSLPAESTISVGILRDGQKLTLDIKLTQFISQSVFTHNIDGYAYILITQFNDKTVDMFVNAVDAAVDGGTKGIIFDLRGNGGGTLTSVYHMVDYLVPEGLVISVDYKGDAYDETYMSDAHEVDLPMAILTDESTASASELFSQSLIDYKKAITVGRNTYGKGVVQRTFTLSDNSLVKFTVAKYYTASGICVDGVGIAPTVPVEWSDSELSYRFINGLELDKDFLAAVDYLETQLS